MLCSSLFIITAALLNSLIMTDSKPLKVACWNSRDCRASVPYLRELLSKNDIVGVCEHWLHENKLSSLDEVSDTHLVHARASDASSAAEYGRGRGQGGTAIFWNKRIKSVSVIPNALFDRACGIRVQSVKGGVCFFWCVYLPAVGSGEDLGVALDELSEVVGEVEAGDSVCVMGDFNGDIGFAAGGRGTRDPTDRGALVRGFMCRKGLVAMNMEAGAVGPLDTFEGPFSASTLDYIMVSAQISHLVRKCWVAEWGDLNLSDHTSVHAEISLGEIPLKVGGQRCSGNVRWDKLNDAEKRGRYGDVIAPELIRLTNVLASGDLAEAAIDEVLDNAIRCVTDASARLPKSKFRKHIKPFWNEELSALKREKVRCHRVWISQGRPRGVEDPSYIAYKTSKKEFSRCLRRLSFEYENEEVLKAVRTAEVNSNDFWRLVKRARGSRGVDSIAVRNQDNKVVYEPEDVLGVWKTHFENLGTPKMAPEFDHEHFVRVSEQVHLYNCGNDVDEFLSYPFTVSEVETGLRSLNKGKACGMDGVSAEHLCYGGRPMAIFLCEFYNCVRVSEYIPKGFRVGVQVPLHKGKDTCPLDPNNYRGITLLSTYNKLFEILLWHRIEDWWSRVGAVSGLQSACKKGMSCLNTAFILKESIATSMEEHELVYTAFFDVAKAFDSVWIDGLFYQLWAIGIRGRTWRVLYRCYLNFWCVARVQGHVSGWYPLKCGIHQGGYMSLIKYTAFINSLIVSLNESGLCCSIRRIPSSPVGYADDLAACCLSERKLDSTLEVVYRHGCTWRYSYNAKKSGIMVFGETPGANRHNATQRNFKLGRDRVKERLSYDHVGVTACLYDEDISGIEGRLAKARRALNSISGLGIRRNGLTVQTCGTIFWSIIVPIALFGCEMWILTNKAVEAIESFQIYAGKKIQRLFRGAPNVCAFYGLGWVRLERVIEIRKLMFIRSLMMLGVDEPSRSIFCCRLEDYMRNIERSSENANDSIVFDMLNVATSFRMLNEVVDMARQGHMWSKDVWKKRVWEKARSLEDEYWRVSERCYRNLDLLSGICGQPRCTIWWEISSLDHGMMKCCESMVRLISHSSQLKMDDVRLKRLPIASRFCTLCDLSSPEDVRHFVMSCPRWQRDRTAMFSDIANIDDGSGRAILDMRCDVLLVLLGRSVDGFTYEQMCRVWYISAVHISRMYSERLREGIG